MNVVALATFWATSLLFVVTPGADWAYAITAGMRRRAVPAVAGLLSGHLFATAVVAAGVGAAIAQIPLGLTVLTVLGAAYLLWLGIGTVKDPPVPREDDGASSGSAGRWFANGLGVSGLNPKVMLLFLALLPQFTDTESGWPLPAQIALLGLVHTFSCAVVYFVVAFSARSVLAARPSVARVVSRVSGAAMIAIAVVLIGEQVFHALNLVN